MDMNEKLRELLEKLENMTQEEHDELNRKYEKYKSEEHDMWQKMLEEEREIADEYESTMDDFIDVKAAHMLFSEPLSGFSKCKICNKDILPNEEYFDYEYWGHNEVVHWFCAYPNKEVEEN